MPGGNSARHTASDRTAWKYHKALQNKSPDLPKLKEKALAAASKRVSTAPAMHKGSKARFETSVTKKKK